MALTVVNGLIKWPVLAINTSNEHELSLKKTNAVLVARITVEGVFSFKSGHVVRLAGKELDYYQEN